MKKTRFIIVPGLILIVVLVMIFLGYIEAPIKGEVSDYHWSETDVFNNETLTTFELDDEFNILLLSDIQIGNSSKDEKVALALIEELVAETNPDLIITAGDNTQGPNTHFAAKRLKNFLDTLETPYALTFGNHDSEGYADRNWHGDVYESGINSLFEKGPSNIHGVGNYVINLEKDDSLIYSFIMMDSNEYRQYEGEKVYDIIYPDQISWYEWVIAGLESSYVSEPKSLLFFHIPLIEFDTAYQAYMNGEITEGVTGVKNEDVASSPLNGGFFDRIVARNSTTHVFNGHDHINTLSIPYQGVQLTYGLKTGPASYNMDDLQGGTLITITEDNVEVENIFIIK